MPTRFANLHRRRGTTIVFVAVIVPVMLAFAALTIDIGLFYNVRVELQNAADAAALAGVQDLGGIDTGASMIAARTAASQFVLLNPVLGDRPISFDPDTDIVFGQARLDDVTSRVVFTPNTLPPNAMRVTVRYELEYTFGQIFGLQPRMVTASATSGIGARDFMIVIDASGSMTKQSVEAEVAADLDALGIPYTPGNAIQNAFQITYDGSDPEFWGVFAVGDRFLPPTVRILPMKSAKDAAAYGVDVVMNAGYDDQIGTASFQAGAPWAQELTTEYATVRAKIRGLNKYGGSDIDVGILAAMAELLSVRARNGADKVMVVFADGQSDAAAALAAAQLAADEGITIHCVGLGANVDQVLLDGIAAIGGGVAIYVLNNTNESVYGPALRDAFQSIASDEVGTGLIQ